MAGKRRKWSPEWRRWARIRWACFQRDLWRCQRCGGAGRLEAHHIISLRSGGAAYDVNNVTTLCRSCHIKHHKPDDATPGRAAWWSFVDDLSSPR